MPTLAERLEMYRDALALAQSDYDLADYIDSTARRDRERAALRPRIAALKVKITNTEAALSDTMEVETMNGFVLTIPKEDYYDMVDAMPHNDLFGPINERNP